VILGGVLAEYFNYHAAFWVAFLGNALGVAFFFAYARQSFIRNRLR
jgi:hypothetical protein